MTKIKKKRRPSVNYNVLKAQYMASDIMEVVNFFKQNNLNFHGGAAKKSTGWRPEKEKMLAEISAREIQRIKDHKQLVLDEALDAAIQVSTRSLKKIAATDTGIKNHKAAKSHWQIIRTESGLPVNITHNTNVTSNDQRDILAAEKLKDKLAEYQAVSEGNEDATKQDAGDGIGGAASDAVSPGAD